MRLLLDECVPARLRRALPSHVVSTVVIEGWSGVKNDPLLAQAAQRFAAFITVDKNLSYQQDTSVLPVAVIVLDAVSTEIPYLSPLIPAWERELGRLTEGIYVLIASDAR